MKHCILVKYIEEVDDQQKLSLKKEIEELFNQLLDIEGINQVEVIPNVINRPNRYDLLIRIEMDEAVLPVYDECVVHKTWKKEYAKYLDKKAIFDYM